MSTVDFSALVGRHGNYFRSGATRPAEWREGQLTALREMMTEHAEAFYEALWTDLRRNRTDADLTDVKYLADEAEHVLGHMPECLDRDAFSVVQGAAPVVTALLDLQWDHIFFTGGTTVAKIVMTAAAKQLTPVVLELGGKSPTIVHSSADLRVAARHITQGRWNNAGQTCTATDYVLVFKDVAGRFLQQLKETVVQFYGADPQKRPDFGRIVNTRHFDRLTGLLESGTVSHGGPH